MSKSFGYELLSDGIITNTYAITTASGAHFEMIDVTWINGVDFVVTIYESDVYHVASV